MAKFWRLSELIPIYGTRCLRGKEAPTRAGGPCTGLQSRPLAFLDIPSVTVAALPRLVPSCEAALHVPRTPVEYFSMR